MSKAKLFIAMAAISCFSSATWADGYEGTGVKGFSPPAQVNWTGVYIGGQIGYGWADVDAAFDFGGGNSFLFDTIGLQKSFGQDIEGWMGGVHLGAQWQRGNWVFGVEGTYDAMNHDGTSSAGFGFDEIDCSEGCVGVALDGKQAVKTEIEDLWTLTARVGHAWGRWLGYVKGGYARAEVSAASAIGADLGLCLGSCLGIGVGFSGTSKEDHHGWTVGAGTAYMVRKNVTLGFEYNYVNLESKIHNVQGSGYVDFEFDGELDGGVDFRARHGLEVDPDSIHAISARLTFLFGPQEQTIVPLK